MIIVRPFTSLDLEKLVIYYNSLDSLSKSRFAPHGFTRNEIGELYSKSHNIIGYVAEDLSSRILVAYAVCKLGFFDYDINKFNEYGFILNEFTDVFYAPSVSNEYRGTGIGTNLFGFVKEDLIRRGYKRVFLWGGVQLSNRIALHYYEKMGFKNIGEFEYQGLNGDMILYL